jgi:adapter protein MecA 1/2
MKLEKINDHQIRCTLSKSDLTDREIKISELAYGTEKAQELFKDMMEQASFEFGFEADNVPLMIEAIPLTTDSIMLIITKVDDPDDLDTKFATLTSNIKKFKKRDSSIDSKDIDSDTVDSSNVPDQNEKKFSVKGDHHILTYSFDSLDDVCYFSQQIASLFTGINSLYKNDVNSRYYLILHNSDFDDTTFKTISGIASEYGINEPANYATEAYYDEHFETIIKHKATQLLSKV